MTGNARSLQSVTRAICGYCDVLTTVKSVVSAVPGEALMSTSKYGSSNVAAGVTPMSQLSSLFVVDGLPLGSVAAPVLIARSIANRNGADARHRVTDSVPVRSCRPRQAPPCSH